MSRPQEEGGERRKHRSSHHTIGTGGKERKALTSAPVVLGLLGCHVRRVCVEGVLYPGLRLCGATRLSRHSDGWMWVDV